MSTAEEERISQVPQKFTNPYYQRLVEQVTGGHWRIKDDHGRRRLTESDIRTRLEEGGTSPEEVTKLNLGDAFRLVTQRCGVPSSHVSGKPEGSKKCGFPVRSRRRWSRTRY